MPNVVKRIFIAILVIIAAIVLVLAGYLAYLQFNYYRIPDGEGAEVANNEAAQQEALATGQAYTALTYNIGFGAYTPDYTFFMDTGYMADGTPTQGDHSTAASRESVLACTEGALSVATSPAADFTLLQEVDTDSTRSWHVNQKDLCDDAFANCAHVFAPNFHSAFLAYPFHNMHGAVNAGLVVESAYAIDDAQRRSYPIDDSFITKFTDLDRCFVVVRVPVEGNHELVLINSHMSAYDEGGKIRAQQFSLFNEVIAEERAKGNYVIAGGDWNHALCGSETMYPTEQLRPDWLAVFNEDELAEGFSVVRAENIEEVPSCRDDDIAWEAGVTYCSTVDGFIVSDNVTATAENVDTNFAYSDHNPVRLTFTLNKDE